MSESKLYYTEPAQAFEEALPLGAGKLGAMIYGEWDQERVGLNYDELWTGFPRDENKPEAAKDYLEARELVKEGKLLKAQRLIENKIGTVSVQAYQPAGDLLITHKAGKTESYARKLSLETATAEVT